MSIAHDAPMLGDSFSVEHSKREGGGSLDWPLSRNEKKSHVLRLYDRDMRAANNLLQHGETALAVLRQELHSLKASAADSNALCPPPTLDNELEVLVSEDDINAPATHQVTPKADPTAHCDAIVLHRDQAGNANQAALRLHQAIAEATKTLGALLGTAALQQEEEDLDTSWEHSCQIGMLRARSEGANRMLQESLPPGGLRKSRQKRLSRGGEKLQVSFADAPAKCSDSVVIFDPDYRAHGPGAPANSDDCEPEPSPEAPPTPERALPHRETLPCSPVASSSQPAQQLKPTWQRNSALLPSASRHRPLPSRFDYDRLQEKSTEFHRSRRQVARVKNTVQHPSVLSNAERIKAPQTAMDFI